MTHRKSRRTTRTTLWHGDSHGINRPLDWPIEDSRRLNGLTSRNTDGNLRIGSVQSCPKFIGRYGRSWCILLRTRPDYLASGLCKRARRWRYSDVAATLRLLFHLYYNTRTWHSMDADFGAPPRVSHRSADRTSEPPSDHETGYISKRRLIPSHA